MYTRSAAWAAPGASSHNTRARSGTRIIVSVPAAPDALHPRERRSERGVEAVARSAEAVVPRLDGVQRAERRVLAEQLAGLPGRQVVVASRLDHRHRNVSKLGKIGIELERKDRLEVMVH